MHSYEVRTKKRQVYRFHFNSDYSGETIVQRTPLGSGVFEEFYLDNEALLSFLAEYIRGVRMAELEDADWKSLLT